MNEGGPCLGVEDVLDADTARDVRPCGSDGHRTGRRWLHGSLPEVRHDGTDAGNVRRSATGAVGAGAAEPEMVTLSCSRSASRRLASSGKKAQAAPVRNGTTTTTHNRRSKKTVYPRSCGFSANTPSRPSCVSAPCTPLMAAGTYASSERLQGNSSRGGHLAYGW